MAMNKALPTTVRSFFARNITIVTTNLKGVVYGVADDSKIRVWWDVQRCRVPANCDAGIVVSNIRDELRRIRCFGPVDIWGYGNMRQLPSQTVSELHTRGVKLRHVPHAHKFREPVMIEDLIAWTTDHPPPASDVIALPLILPLFLF